MQGMSAATGKSLGGLDHLRQSVRDILLTPIGTRVMRRDYGSDIFKLIDAPLNGETLLRFYAATVGALRKWEPRLDIQRVEPTVNTPGALEITIWAIYLPEGRLVSLDGIKLK